MIVIKDQDFEMEQYKNTPHFDLKMNAVVNEGKPNQRTEMKVVGYGIPFESCLQLVISYRLHQEDKVYSILEYIDAFNKEADKISKLIQVIDKPVKKKKNEDKDEDENEDEEVEDIIEEEE